MYALLLFILFPILYKQNRTWYFIYSLLFFVLGRFIAFKLGISYAVIIHNVFYIGVLIPFLTDKTYWRYFLHVFLWLLVYMAYLFFLHAIHGNDFVRDLKDHFWCLFVFIFIVEVFDNLKRNKVDLAYFVKVFQLVLLFEIVLCWLQYFFHDFGNFFRITEYTWKGEEMSMTGTSDDVLDNNLCYGTLMRASTMASFLAISLGSLFLAKQKNGLTTRDFFFLGLGVLTLLITGIRAPFLVLLVMLFFVLLRGKRTSLKVLYIVGGIALVVFVLPILSQIGSQGSLNSLDNTVLRSLNVFTQLETGSFAEESTFTWPLSMLPYIVEHPLIGNGLHYGPGYFMAINFHVLEDLSLSDAGIFFYWAEYGLIGLLVFFYFYYYIVIISPRYGFEKSDIRFLIIMLLLQSIVDCSIIDTDCTTVFALAPILIRFYQEQAVVKRNAKYSPLTKKVSLSYE